MQLVQGVFIGGVVEQKFAKLADRETADGGESRAVERVENQAADFVAVRIDQRLLDDFAQGHVGQGPLGGHAFALAAGGDSGQGVARFFFVGLGEQFAQVGECKPLAADGAVIGQVSVSARASILVSAKRA